MAQAMTKEDLVKTIRETTVPLMREIGGTLVAEAVEEAVARHVKSAGQPSWAAELIAGLSGGNGRPEPAPVRQREQGMAFGRIVRAIAKTKMDGAPASSMVRYLEAWGDDDLAKAVTDMQTKAMAAGAPTQGGFLVPDQFSQDVIEFLRPRVVIRALGPMTIPMATGTIRIPKITAGTTAFYQGENTNATPSQLGTGQITLTFKKLVALVPISNDLLRYSSPGADSIVRNDVVRAMAVRENQAFIRDNGTAATPKGLRFWANPANILAANGTVSLANTVTDLGRCIVTLLNQNIPMTKPAWIFAPRTWNFLNTLLTTNGVFVFRDELSQGRLMGFPYAWTTQIPINLTDHGGAAESEIYLVDLDDAVIGDSQNLIIDVSMEAAYFDGTSVVAAYSQDQTVIRAIAEHDFAMRRDTSVAVMNGVNWS